MVVNVKLTSAGVDTGPTFNVYSSPDDSAWTLVATGVAKAFLTDPAGVDYTVAEGTAYMKIQSIGTCTNFIVLTVEGTTTSTTTTTTTTSTTTTTTTSTTSTTTTSTTTTPIPSGTVYFNFYNNATTSTAWMQPASVDGNQLWFGADVGKGLSKSVTWILTDGSHSFVEGLVTSYSDDGIFKIYRNGSLVYSSLVNGNQIKSTTITSAVGDTYDVYLEDVAAITTTTTTTATPTTTTTTTTTSTSTSTTSTSTSTTSTSTSTTSTSTSTTSTSTSTTSTSTSTTSTSTSTTSTSTSTTSTSTSTSTTTSTTTTTTTTELPTSYTVYWDFTVENNQSGQQLVIYKNGDLMIDETLTNSGSFTADLNDDIDAYMYVDCSGSVNTGDLYVDAAYDSSLCPSTETSILNTPVTADMYITGNIFTL